VVGAVLVGFGAMPAFGVLYGLRIPRTPLALGLALVVGALPWLAAEVFFQYAWAESDAFGWLSRNFARRHYHADAFGLRDSGLPLSETHPNLLVIGDSLAFGSGLAEVSDRFGNRLRALIPNDHVVVLSSVGGGPLEQSELVQRFARGASRVAGVVLSYTANDILDAAPKGYAPAPAGREAWRPCFERSELVRHVFHRLCISPSAYDAALGERIAAAFADSEIFARHAQQLRTLIAHATRGEPLPVWILRWPDLTKLREEPDWPQLRELAAAEGWRALDVGAWLAGRAPASLVVSARDRHPNAAVHGFVAERLAAELARESTQR
jgi:hypothetical protein